MAYFRRYGWYIFAVPWVVFLLDDIATNWHDHGHERILYIVLENIIEDFAVLLFWLTFRTWQTRAIAHIHAECPNCHFKWVMHPKQKIPFCPHCGAPEPS
jgi:hypothetical protein